MNWLSHARLSAVGLCASAALLAIPASAGASPSPYRQYSTASLADAPCEVTGAANGDEYSENIGTSTIGQLDPRTGAFADLPIPTALSVPGGMTLGSDGNVWFSEVSSGKMAALNPTTHDVSEYPIPGVSPLTPGLLPVADDTKAGADGNVWFTENGTNAIGSINPTTHQVREYPIPSPLAGPLNIDNGPNDSIVFPEYFEGKVGQINEATGKVTEYDTGALTFYATTGPDGAIWFDTQGPNAGIGRIDPHTGAITEYPITSPVSPSPAPATILSASDGNLWVNLGNSPFPGQFGTAADIGRFNITTHQFTVFSTPGVCDLQFADGSRSVMWGGELTGGKLLSFNTTVADQESPASSAANTVVLPALPITPGL